MVEHKCHIFTAFRLTCKKSHFLNVKEAIFDLSNVFISFLESLKLTALINFWFHVYWTQNSYPVWESKMTLER